MIPTYHIIDGWFPNNGGMHKGRFYGAFVYSETKNPLMVVLDGDEALEASEMARTTPRMKPDLVEMMCSGAIAMMPMALTPTTPIKKKRRKKKKRVL